MALYKLCIMIIIHRPIIIHQYFWHSPGFDRVNALRGPVQGFDRVNALRGPVQGVDRVNALRGPVQGFDRVNALRGPSVMELDPVGK